MKLTTGIKSNTEPLRFAYDDSSVYVRTNIQKTTQVDPIFLKEVEEYTYDETEYSIMEYMMALDSRITALERK